MLIIVSFFAVYHFHFRLHNIFALMLSFSSIFVSFRFVSFLRLSSRLPIFDAAVYFSLLYCCR